jgi:tRNA (cmo5U34)-methyltransferase
MKKSINRAMDEFSEMKKILADSALILRPKAKNILDLGCGGAWLAEDLIKKFPDAEFSLLDIQERMVKIAEKRLNNPKNVNFIQADMRKINFPTRSFDIITSMLSFQLLNLFEFMEIIRKCKRWLKRGGVLLVCNFFSYYNHKISDIQKKLYYKYIKEEFDSTRAENMEKGFDFSFHCSDSADVQVDIVRSINFLEVELLYQRFNTCGYYAIKF